MSRWIRIKALAALGAGSLLRVGAYRIGLRFGLHSVQRIAADTPRGPFFSAASRSKGEAVAYMPATNMRWANKLWWFDWYSTDRTGCAPRWSHSPFGQGQEVADRNWWEIPDFAGTDIKGIWELSRFGWLVPMATQAAHGDDDALRTMNQWLNDWLEKNPPYRGANWKCGQEASFRVIHLLAVAMVLDQVKSAPQALIDLVSLHLKRIAPTLSYAIGQDNNHGTSEAAALFCGGSFLALRGVAGAQKWADKGRHWLENRAAHLISPDGSFSQYSTVYHRLMLDSFSFVEGWRRRMGLKPFSRVMQGRLEAATAWLDAVVDRHSGDAVNFGANDGARILPFTDTDYRDFLPSLQTAAVLFCQKRALSEPGIWDVPLQWMDVPLPTAIAELPKSQSFDDGGMHVLRVGQAAGYLRYPRFRFRPSQSDLLHFDLWADGRNLLRDAGSFSYNASAEDSAYFPSPVAHNTVTFDGRDQMPRVSRFLFGEWAKAEDVTFEDGGDSVRASAAYTDSLGVRHHREVHLKANRFICRDTVSGAFEQAILRWRLIYGEYNLEENRLTGEHLQLRIECDDPNAQLCLNSGEESLYYMQKSQIPVLELAVSRPCSIVTTGEF